MTLATDLADTLVAAINLMDLPLPPNAIRYYQPKFLLEDLEALKVCVVPTQVEQEDISRGTTAQTTTIQIGVMKVCDKSIEALDELSELVETIVNELNDFEIIEPEQSTITDVQIILLYEPEYLNKNGQFTSVIEVTVRSFLQ